MRIAILGDTSSPIPSLVSGLGIMVHQIAEGLLKRGHDVVLFASNGSQFSGQLVTPTDPDYQGGEPKLARSAIEVHKQRPFDVFYDHGHSKHLARIFPNLPVVSHYHDRWMPYARCPVLCSHGQQQLMAHVFGGARVIHNQLDATEFIPSYRHDGYVAFCGVARGYKNPMLAIEAVSRLRVPLKIAGNGFGDMLSDIQGNASYVGVLSRSEIKEFMRGAMIYLQTGRQEAGPLTNIEAGLSGTPTVAFPSGGNLDYIKTGVNGALIDTTCEDMVDAVVEGIHAAMSLDRKTVREYTAEHWGNVTDMLGQVEQALESCASGNWW